MTTSGPNPGSPMPSLTDPPEGPTTLAETMVPPTEATTPRTETAAERTRRPRRRTTPDPTEMDDPEERRREATAIDEAEGVATSGWTTGEEGPTRSRPAARRGTATTGTTRRPTRTPRRPRLDAATEGFADADGSSPDATAATRRVLNDLADAGGTGAARRGPVKPTDWEEFLTVLLGFISMLYMWWLVAGFQMSKGEQDSLMLTEDEASGLAAPMAKIMARSWINRQYGHHVLGAADYVIMAVVMAEYAKRTAPYARRKISTYGLGPRRAARPGVDQEALRRRAAEEAARNGHVDGAPAGPRPVVVHPISAT